MLDLSRDNVAVVLADEGEGLLPVLETALHGEAGNLEASGQGV